MDNKKKLMILHSIPALYAEDGSCMKMSCQMAL